MQKNNEGWGVNDRGDVLLVLVNEPVDFVFAHLHENRLELHSANAEPHIFHPPYEVTAALREASSILLVKFKAGAHPTEEDIPIRKNY